MLQYPCNSGLRIWCVTWLISISHEWVTHSSVAIKCAPMTMLQCSYDSGWKIRWLAGLVECRAWLLYACHDSFMRVTQLCWAPANLARTARVLKRVRSRLSGLASKHSRQSAESWLMYEWMLISCVTESCPMYEWVMDLASKHRRQSVRSHVMRMKITSNVTCMNQSWIWLPRHMTWLSINVTGESCHVYGLSMNVTSHVTCMNTSWIWLNDVAGNLCRVMSHVWTLLSRATESCPMSHGSGF